MTWHRAGDLAPRRCWEPGLPTTGAMTMSTRSAEAQALILLIAAEQAAEEAHSNAWRVVAAVAAVKEDIMPKIQLARARAEADAAPAASAEAVPAAPANVAVPAAPAAYCPACKACLSCGRSPPAAAKAAPKYKAVPAGSNEAPGAKPLAPMTPVPGPGHSDVLPVQSMSPPAGFSLPPAVDMTDQQEATMTAARAKNSSGNKRLVEADDSDTEDNDKDSKRKQRHVKPSSSRNC